MIEIEFGTLARSTAIQEGGAMSVPPRHLVCVFGPSSSGKSEFCRAAAGLGHSSRAQIKLNGRLVNDLSAKEAAQTIGYVPSDATLAFSGLKTTLAGEMDLAARLTGLNNPGNRIDLVIKALELQDHLEQDPFTLSGGEAVRAAVALAILKAPVLLILDQIFDQVTGSSRELIWGAVVRLLPDQAVVILASARDFSFDFESSASELPQKSNMAISMLALDIELPAWLRQMPPKKHSLPREATGLDESQRRLHVDGISYTYPSANFSLGPLSFDAAVGERVALVGENGVGKSTLLKGLALLVEANWKRYTVFDSSTGLIEPPADSKSKHLWANTALFSFQRPEDQIYLPRVRDELISFASSQEMIDRAYRYGSIFGLDPFLDNSPFDLPRSFRRLLLLCAILATERPVLLLDEPTVGLDQRQVQKLVEVINGEARESTIIMISHDTAFINAVSTRVLTLTSPNCINTSLIEGDRA